jgi:hypothetical protein
MPILAIGSQVDPTIDLIKPFTRRKDILLVRDPSGSPFYAFRRPGVSVIRVPVLGIPFQLYRASNHRRVRTIMHRFRSFGSALLVCIRMESTFSSASFEIPYAIAVGSGG